MVLVDDASEDSSFEIAKAFVDEDSRFILIKNTKRQRQGKAKNQAIDYIIRGGQQRVSKPCVFGKKRFERCDYIFFLDSDDLLTKDALATLANIAKDKKPDVVLSSIKIFGEYDKTIIYDEGYKSKDSVLKNARYFSFGCGGLIAINLFENGLRFVDSIYMVNDDNFFGLYVFLNASRIYYSSHICWHVRIHYGSTSHKGSYHLNGDDALYHTYFLNAYHIKSLIKEHNKYEKILRFNATYNANAFIAMSNKLNIYDKERINHIKDLVSIKYKIFILSPSIFKMLKNTWGVIKRLPNLQKNGLGDIP